MKRRSIAKTRKPRPSLEPQVRLVRDTEPPRRRATSIPTVRTIRTAPPPPPPTPVIAEKSKASEEVRPKPTKAAIIDPTLLGLRRKKQPPTTELELNTSVAIDTTSNAIDDVKPRPPIAPKEPTIPDLKPSSRLPPMKRIEARWTPVTKPSDAPAIDDVKPSPPIAPKKPAIDDVKPSPPIAPKKHAIDDVKPSPPIAPKEHAIDDVKPSPPIAPKEHASDDVKPSPPIARKKHAIDDVKPSPPIAPKEHAIHDVKPSPQIARKKHAIPDLITKSRLPPMKRIEARWTPVTKPPDAPSVTKSPEPHDQKLSPIDRFQGPKSEGKQGELLPKLKSKEDRRTVNAPLIIDPTEIGRKITKIRHPETAAGPSQAPEVEPPQKKEGDRPIMAPMIIDPTERARTITKIRYPGAAEGPPQAPEVTPPPTEKKKKKKSKLVDRKRPKVKIPKIKKPEPKKPVAVKPVEIELPKSSTIMTLEEKNKINEDRLKKQYHNDVVEQRKILIHEARNRGKNMIKLDKNMNQLTDDFGIPPQKTILDELIKKDYGENDFRENLRLHFSPVVRNYILVNMTDRYRAPPLKSSWATAPELARIGTKPQENEKMMQKKYAYKRSLLDPLEEVAVDETHLKFLRELAICQPITLPLTIMHKTLQTVLPIAEDTYLYYLKKAPKDHYYTQAAASHYIKIKNRIKMYDQM